MIIKRKRFIYLPSKEERMSDLQFLYKVSHKSTTKKVDFRIKYNVKISKQRKKTNEMCSFNKYSTKNPVS